MKVLLANERWGIHAGMWPILMRRLPWLVLCIALSVISVMVSRKIAGGKTDIAVFKIAADLLHVGAYDDVYDRNVISALYTSVDFTSGMLTTDVYRSDMPRPWYIHNGWLFTFQYPPFYYWVIAPMAFMSLNVARFYMTVGSLAFCVYALWRTVKPEQRLWTLAAFFAFRSTLSTITTCQNTFLTLGLLLTGIRLLPTRPVLSAAAFSLLAYKPQFLAPILAFLVLRKHYKPLAYVFGWLGVHALAVTACYGLHPWRRYALSLAGTSYDMPRIFWGANGNATFLGGLYDFGFSYDAAYNAHLYFAAGIVAFACVAARRARTDSLAFIAVIAAAGLYSPYLLRYDVLLWFGVAVLMFQQPAFAAPRVRYSVIGLMVALDLLHNAKIVWAACLCMLLLYAMACVKAFSKQPLTLKGRS